MEQSCYRCGTAVEEGIAFCPQCNAPQIRVASPEPLAPIAITPDEVTGQQAPESASSQPTPIQWSQALRPAALAGLVAALVMVVPVGAFGLGLLAAGGLSVLLYRKRNPGANLTPGMGARLGMASGAVGFGIFALLTSVEMVVSRSGGQLRETLQKAIQQAPRSSDPQAQEILEYFKTPSGLVVMFILSMAVLFVIFLICSSLGGALGAVLLRRKNRP